MVQEVARLRSPEDRPPPAWEGLAASGGGGGTAQL